MPSTRLSVARATSSASRFRSTSYCTSSIPRSNSGAFARRTRTCAPSWTNVTASIRASSGRAALWRGCSSCSRPSRRRTARFSSPARQAAEKKSSRARFISTVRGAFTGAVGSRQGRLEQAHKGTLFLDEVGTMSSALQMKLLRVLQEREFERIGDTHTTKVDVRIIAATNSDLRRMVADSTFREDLYYRLNVIPVQIPPLRDRKEDIPLLVQHFLDKFRPDTGSGTRTPMTVSQQAMRQLMQYHWPGNVRQLENAIERAVAFTAGRSQIDVQDLPPEIQQTHDTFPSTAITLPENGLDLAEYVGRIEKELIQLSLERTGGNKGQAAKLLNLKRTTLVEKLKRL